jgi:hypothetical protein
MGMTRSVRVGDCHYPGFALGKGARNDVQPVRTPRCTGRIMIKHSETAYNLVTKASKVWWREGACIDPGISGSNRVPRSLFFIYLSASAIPRRCVPFAELSRVPESWMVWSVPLVHLHLARA